MTRLYSGSLPVQAIHTLKSEWYKKTDLIVSYPRSDTPAGFPLLREGGSVLTMAREAPLAPQLLRHGLLQALLLVLPPSCCNNTKAPPLSAFAHTVHLPGASFTSLSTWLISSVSL